MVSSDQPVSLPCIPYLLSANTLPSVDWVVAALTCSPPILLLVFRVLEYPLWTGLLPFYVLYLIMRSERAAIQRVVEATVEPAYLIVCPGTFAVHDKQVREDPER